jgi:hypothetical protein
MVRGTCTGIQGGTGTANRIRGRSGWAAFFMAAMTDAPLGDLAIRCATSQWARQRIPEPQAVNINPAGAHTVGIPAAVPTVSAVAEPNVAIVRFAHDVMLVGGSIFVLVRASISVVATMVAFAVVAFSVMAAAVMPTTVVPASLTSTFRVRRPHYSKSERRSDRKDERNLLQHFCFFLLG